MIYVCVIHFCKHVWENMVKCHVLVTVLSTGHPLYCRCKQRGVFVEFPEHFQHIRQKMFFMKWFFSILAVSKYSVTHCQAGH